MLEQQDKNIKNQISPKQLFSLILILVVVVMALSIRTWFVALKLPFITPENERTALNNKTPNNNLDNSPYSTDSQTLKNRDTDLDGLTDYDELYIYQTSPYISDTDSDNISDGQEIKNGTNPNCAQGKDCSGAVTGGELNKNNLSAQQIRELLAKSGVAPEELNKLDDQSLLKMYQETVASMAPANPQTISTNGPQVDLQKIKNLPDFLSKMSGLSIAEIRQNLLNQGFSKTELDKINDEQLKEVWLKVINESVKDSKALETLNNPNVTQ